MNHKKNIGRVIALMLLLTAVFTQSSISAQSLDATGGITINYVCTTGAEGSVEVSTIAPMHYYNNKSVFFLNSDQEGSTKFENDEFGDMKVKMTLVNELGDIYFIDRNDKKITAQRVIFDEPANVEEGIPVFVWSITGESKKIAEHHCYEATTSFRGRSYSAWFTPDVPLDVGPWKFSGLPGAILQVNDKEGRYNWYCKSIGKLLPEYKELIKAPQSKKIFSPKEFHDLTVEKIMAMLEEMTINPNVNITSEPNIEASLERTFN